MEILGNIIFIGETQQISEKFKKREFVIETDEQYPQQIKLQFEGDKCSILDNYDIGQQATVYFNLRGRSYTDKQNQTQYANTLQAWKIQR